MKHHLNLNQIKPRNLILYTGDCFMETIRFGFKKALLSILMMGLCIACIGCSTKSSLEWLEPSIKIAPTDKFEIGEVTDQSGFVPAESELEPAEAMKKALVTAMQRENLLGNEFKIDTTVLAYSPGNAFSRWLVPGMGATHLKTISYIYGKDGNKVAELPVERKISAGGGFTIGAWREVFSEVAEEIVEVIQEKFLKIKQKKSAPAHKDTSES